MEVNKNISRSRKMFEIYTQKFLHSSSSQLTFQISHFAIKITHRISGNMTYEADERNFQNIRQEDNEKQCNCNLQLFPLQTRSEIEHAENLGCNQRKVVCEIQ